MAELVAAIPLAQLGGTGVTIIALLWVFRKVLTGDLVPRQTHEDTKGERDHWRTVAEKERDGHEETRKQVSRLLDMGRTFDHTWESIRDQGREASNGST